MVKFIFGLSIWYPKYILEGLKPEILNENLELADLYFTAFSIFMWEGSKFFILNQIKDIPESHIAVLRYLPLKIIEDFFKPSESEALKLAIMSKAEKLDVNAL